MSSIFRWVVAIFALVFVTLACGDDDGVDLAAPCGTSGGQAACNARCRAQVCPTSVCPGGGFYAAGWCFNVTTTPDCWGCGCRTAESTYYDDVFGEYAACGWTPP